MIIYTHIREHNSHNKNNRNYGDILQFRWSYVQRRHLSEWERAVIADLANGGVVSGGTADSFSNTSFFQ